MPNGTDVIVIGGGPAGLAVGSCLNRKNIPCIILEQNDRVGSSWHRHYDRLHLHTDKRNSSLPFLPFPKEYPRYPSRSQVIEYLESYAKNFQLDIRFRQQVISARYENERWEVQTSDHMYQASNLVVAAGYNYEPVLPSWPGQDRFKGLILHSSKYKNGEQFRGRNVLVVGFGNSGGEISIDLWEHGAQVSFAVRGPVNVIPRELFGIPTLSIGILQRRFSTPLMDAINAVILRAVIGDLTKYGFRKLPYGPITQIKSSSRIPLIDVGTVKLIKEGRIKIHEGIKEFTKHGVIFADGTQEDYEAVILATGYRPRVDQFLARLAAGTYDKNGRPLSSGRETKMPGLYFCGYYVSPTGMLREIAMEAKQITAKIAGAIT